MAASIVVLECPFCGEIFEAESPDKLHSAYSTRIPKPSSYHCAVIKKKHKCQNPKCKKIVTIYWYAPLDYFNRM